MEQSFDLVSYAIASAHNWMLLDIWDDLLRYTLLFFSDLYIEQELYETALKYRIGFPSSFRI